MPTQIYLNLFRKFFFYVSGFSPGSEKICIVISTVDVDVPKFPNHHIRVVVTGKRVNRGIGLGLEIPVDYVFHEDNQVVNWF